MAVVNQYKFIGIDNSTSGSALTPLGSGVPAVNETIVIKSILVTSAGTPTVTIINNSITAIKSAQLTANTTTELLTQPLIVEGGNNVMSEIKMLTPEKIITTIKNKKTGEVYETEEALKAANIPEEDVQRDVTVIMPALDLFAKTK
jgi:hypothetical protein